MKRSDILIADFLHLIVDKLKVPAKAGDQISVVIDRIALSVDDLIKENAELKEKLEKAIDGLERIICHVESGEGYLDIGIIAEKAVAELGGEV